MAHALDCVALIYMHIDFAGLSKNKVVSSFPLSVIINHYGSEDCIVCSLSTKHYLLCIAGMNEGLG